MEKTDILSLSKEELEEKILAMGEKKFRAGQIYDWLHINKVEEFSKMTNLSAQLREKLDDIFWINSLKIQKRLVSDIDNTVKYLYGLSDGEKVETVLMEYKHGNSICISTQVGCKMGCKFCASTKAGFVRNLEPSEMLLQIYESERDSGRKINHVVLMGIGEPLDNFENTVKFLKNVSEKGGLNVSQRNISLSTCGLAPKIYELADGGFSINLTISLHSPFDEKRKNIMPVAKRYSVREILNACAYYFEKTGRRYIFEYVLIEGENDTKECADELIRLLKGRPCHVNLIRLNEVKEKKLKAVTDKNAYRFLGLLERGGLSATLRRQIGADIEGACGQLRQKYMESGERL